MESTVMFIARADAQQLLALADKVFPSAEKWADDCMGFLRQHYGAVPTEETRMIFYETGIGRLLRDGALPDVEQGVAEAVDLYKPKCLGLERPGPVWHL